MASNIDDASVVMQFRDIAVDRLEELALALPALIPQTEEDARLFKSGLKAINNLVFDLKHSENPREVSRYVDVQKVLHDFDGDTIRTFKTKLSNSAQSSVNQLSQIARALQEEDE